MASLRKWVNIPDGGLLWTNIELKNQFFDHDLTFFEKRLHAQCMRHEFLLTGNQLLKTEYIKIFSTVSKIIDKDKKPSKMSAYTYEIVKRTDFDWISKIRKINVATLIETLKEANIICIQEMAGASDIYVPILVNNRKQLQRRLSEMGIFCTIIWPLNEEQRKKSNLARYIEEHMLAIYCDQRYKTEDMRYIASQIVRLNSE